MNLNKRYAYIAAYFLSKYDKQALESLGYSTDKEAFNHIAEKLGILPNYIKFRRDEFDVEHPHRKGWHKRKMSLSTLSIINTFQELNFAAMERIVKELLTIGREVSQVQDIQKLISTLDENTPLRESIAYTPRSITGRKAEEAFMEWVTVNANYFGQNAKFEDTRDHGCGYDFRIHLVSGSVLGIEVKGLTTKNSGILLTSKEWDTALAMQDNYFLVLVSSMESFPVIEVIQNPGVKLLPKLNIQTVLQVNWTLTAGELLEHKFNL